jgi:outer membrane protein assembly factor BamB
MDTNDILLLGLKKRVAAISKADGHEIWSTELSGAMGNGFVTVLCDGANVFAYTGGHLHCLDIVNGQILWDNDLPGYGYGMATLAFADGRSAPDSAAVQVMLDQADAASSGVAGSGPAVL